jgi:hypothetical protein
MVSTSECAIILMQKERAYIEEKWPGFYSVPAALGKLPFLPLHIGTSLFFARRHPISQSRSDTFKVVPGCSHCTMVHALQRRDGLTHPIL